jgi:acetyl-CoA carboxylase biotin carboxyl carrier protein
MSDKDRKDSIDLKKVKELIELMKENDLVELEIEAGHDKIMLKRPAPAQPTVTHIPVPVAPTAAPIAPAVQQPASPETAAEPVTEPGIVEITSPIVGTFYAAPSPDADDYVQVGSNVSSDSIVCIVEAMKVMNEIKAETTGTITEVLCQAGQAVEYGQVLFKVKTV